MTHTLLRGRLLSFLRAPQDLSDSGSYLYESDGALLIKDGLIVACGAYDKVSPHAPADAVTVDEYFGESP